jgi:Tfp pilus assembly major pilin PilA
VWGRNLKRRKNKNRKKVKKKTIERNQIKNNMRLYIRGNRRKQNKRLTKGKCKEKKSRKEELEGQIQRII